MNRDNLRIADAAQSVPPMLRWLVAIPLTIMLGFGSSAVVQVVAWAGMLATRTIEQGWDRAVDTTFDGKHPCSMCCAAASLKKAEEAAPTRAPGKGDPSPYAKLVKKMQALESTPIAILAASVESRLECCVEPLVPGEQFRPQPEPPPPRC